MVAFPPCKINLGIQVLNRRADGFHNIETCFYPVPRTDILEVVSSSRVAFELTGLQIPGEHGENLCVKAYELLRKDFSLPPVLIHLHKVIPTGAGLGGGSSDGTWTLRLLNDHFQLGLSTEKLSTYAEQLGSDCSFFLHDSPQIGTGRGETLSPVAVSLKGKFLVIVRPEVHVSTMEAYAGITPRQPEYSIRSIVVERDVAEWQGTLINQFETHIAKLFPVIGKLKKELYDAGAVYASMSGSGSAVYGIFNNEVKLRDQFGMQDFWEGKLII
jgi:4-diphosphocytidyl-2-C-methyl-D-erythritol kinase